MKISKFYLIATVLFSITSNAQISKGNWMMGGSASFSNSNSKSNEISVERTSFFMNPNIGYFFIDKLAVGGVIQLGASTGYDTNYGFGPFVRYYFLEKEKTLNIFSEVSYDIIKYFHNDVKYQTFNIKAGAVYFLNSSVGLEAALNYSKQKNNIEYQNKNIYLSVGFQIHLESE